jgi:hypothetical protein
MFRTATASLSLVLGFYLAAPHPAAADALTSRDDFVNLANNTIAMGNKHGVVTTKPECAEYGCSTDTVFQNQGTWYAVSYIWGNGPDKGPDHLVIQLCAGNPNEGDGQHRTCYDSDGKIWLDKMAGGEFHADRILRPEIPAWRAAATPNYVQH